MTDDNSSRPLYVMLVEDTEADVLIVKECFRKNKINNPLYVADDGVAAMQMLRRENQYADYPLPDLIFLDLNMPNKNGHETLAEIKADSKLKNIPVVILTSSKAETDILKTYDLQADNYIVKPVDREKFLEVISSIDNASICAMTDR